MYTRYLLILSETHSAAPRGFRQFRGTLCTQFLPTYETCASFDYYRECESGGRPCHCAAALRSLTRRAEISCRAHRTRLVGSVGDNKGVSKTTSRLSSLHKRVSGSNAYQIALFSAFQKGVSNPLIKTALRFISSAKITLKVVWKPYFYARKVMINAPSVGVIFPGPAITQKVYHQGIKCFSQLAGLQ